MTRGQGWRWEDDAGTGLPVARDSGWGVRPDEEGMVEKFCQSVNQYVLLIV